MKHFESFMAPQLQQYAAYRQALGYAKKCIKPPLLAFDRYLIEQKGHLGSASAGFFPAVKGQNQRSPQYRQQDPVSASQLFSIFSATGHL
jgi:hypothetical protein